MSAGAGSEGGISRRLTFDSFVVSPGSAAAFAAAREAAQAPGRVHNPLVLNGRTAVGRTHLLHSIGNHVRSHLPALSVGCATSETLVADLVGALRAQRQDAFARRYRSYDVLLVDDVQLLAGKPRIQQELLHTFPPAVEAGKQLVVVCGGRVRDATELEVGLRSRFANALAVEVGAPDLEARVAILRRKLDRDGRGLDEPEVLRFVALAVSTSVRELEGALNRVLAWAAVSGKPASVELARDALRGVCF